MYDRTQIKNCQLHVLDRIVKELHNISLLPVKEILHHKITFKNSSKPKFSLKPKQCSIPIIFFLQIQIFVGFNAKFVFINKLLFKFKNVSSLLCSFFNYVDKIPLHIFYTSNVTKPLPSEFILLLKTLYSQPANICLLKVNNRNIKKRCKTWLKLTIKTPKRHH